MIKIDQDFELFFFFGLYLPSYEGIQKKEGYVFQLQLCYYLDVSVCYEKYASKLGGIIKMIISTFSLNSIVSHL